MKEFIQQCIKDQEAINGIRQLYFLEVDHDGERKLRITIEGILKTCEQFPYIPQEAQQKIIRDQMVKDQDYDALNSRTVWKWLDKAKDVYWAKAQEPVNEVKDIGPLAPETEELIKNHLAELASQIAQERRPKFADRLKEEMEKIATEDKERVEGRKNLVAANHEHLEFRARMENAKNSRGLHQVPFHELKTFTVEGKPIVARNQEEAQEIYLEVYL